MSVVNTSNFAAEPIPQTNAPLAPQGGASLAPQGGAPVAPTNAARVALPPSNPPASGRPLHRLAEVRRREGITRPQLAHRLGISIAEVKRQEHPAADISLSELYHWQKALEVPMAELLCEPPIALSPPVELRAKLLRAMKTVRSIETGARQVSIRRLTTMLIEQLVDVMPELQGTIAWPTGDTRFADPIEPVDWRVFCKGDIP
jgi:transcriptional regulator with XRE-family HTH domain